MRQKLTRGVWRAWIIVMMVGAVMAWSDSPIAAEPPSDPLHRLAVQLAEDQAPSASTSTPAAALSPIPDVTEEVRTPAQQPPGADAQESATTPPAEAPVALPRRSLGQWNSASEGGDASAATPAANGNASGGTWALQTITALGVVIALVFALRVVWVKMTGHVPVRASSPVLEVLSRTTIAPRNQVVMLRLGGRILVVGDSPAGLRTLANVDDPEEVASLLTAITAAKPTSMSQGFSQLVHRFSNDYERSDLDLEGGDRAETGVNRARYSVSGLLSRLRQAGVAR